ncbi:putative ribonuclease H-like domain-containing protein [Tanacetum coccineum]
MKEFIAALKEGDRSRSRGSNNSDGESGVLSIPDEEKVEIASMHLEGDALDLYAWLSDDHSLTFWEELVQAFTKNFGPIEFQNPDEFLYVAINKDRDIVAKLAPSRKKLPKSVSCNSGKAASYHDEDVLMNELKLATQPVVPFGVQIGNGDVIRCGQICKNLSVQINDLKITQDFHHFSLGGADLILGVQWYREYDLAHLKLIFEFSIYTVWIVVFDSGIQSERSMLLMKIENKGLKSLLLLALSVVLQVPISRRRAMHHLRETSAPPDLRLPLLQSLWEANNQGGFGGIEESKEDAGREKIQLEVHGAPISKEDINQKFLRIPSRCPWKSLLSSTSTSQNLAFLSSENTSSTNEVSTANGDFGVSTAGGISQVSSTLCAHDIDEDDLEELDLRWQVAMLTARVRKFIQKTRRNIDFKEKRHVLLINQKLSATTVTEKGTLLGNADLEGINGEDLMVTMSGAMHQQMNLHHRHRSSDEENTPANGRFSKADGFHVVPPLITGNFLTPRADISFAGLDEYAIRKKIIESKTTDLNTKNKCGLAMTEDEQVLHDELEKMIAQEVVAKPLDDATRQAFKEEKRNIASQKRAAQTTSINKLSTGANAGESSFVYIGGKIPIDASTLPNAVQWLIFNIMVDTLMSVLFPHSEFIRNHQRIQILGYPKSAVQTRGKIQKDFFSTTSIGWLPSPNRIELIHKIIQNCLLACFLSQEEPKNISQALQDERWVEAMQEELLQFKLQKVWILVDLPSRKKAIGTKWEEGIDYDEVFAPVARIEAIRLFLAFASYMGFTIYQIVVLICAFLFGTIEEEVLMSINPQDLLICHPNSLEGDQVSHGLIKLEIGMRHFLLSDGKWFQERYHRQNIVSQEDKSGYYVGPSVCGALFWLYQRSLLYGLKTDKYVADILKKFDFWSIRTATTLIESNKPLVKDEDGLLWANSTTKADMLQLLNFMGKLIWIMHIEIDFILSDDCYEKRVIELSRSQDSKLTRWAPNFNDTLDDNTDIDDESVDSKFDDNHKEVFTEKASEIDEILETVFEEREQGELKSSDIKEDHKEVLEEVQSEDPFDIKLSLCGVYL